MAKNHIHLPPVVERIKGILSDNKYLIIHDQPIEAGHKITLSNGAMVNIYCTGRIVVQGINTDDVKLILGIK